MPNALRGELNALRRGCPSRPSACQEQLQGLALALAKLAVYAAVGEELGVDVDRATLTQTIFFCFDIRQLGLLVRVTVRMLPEQRFRP